MALLPVLGRARLLCILVGGTTLFLSTLLHWTSTSAWTRGTPSPAWLNGPVVAALVAEHIDLQRLSYRRDAPAMFELQSTDGESCRVLEELRKALEGPRWLKLTLGGGCAASEPDLQQGGPSPNDTAGRHSIIFSSLSSLPTLISTLEAERPSCLDCASLLITVHSSSDDLALAERTLDSLLDTTKLPFLIHRDVMRLSSGGFLFSLRRQPLTLQEQASLDQFIALQTRDELPCDKLKFVVHEMMPSGFGSVIATIARLSYFAVEVERPLILVPNDKFAYLNKDYCASGTLDCYFHTPLFRPHHCTSYVLQQLAVLPPLINARATSGLKQLDPTDRTPGADFWLLEWPTWTGMTDAFYNRLSRSGLDPVAARSYLLVATPRRAVRDLMKQRLIKLDASVGARYISVHVRHGDKSMESKLVEFATYMDTVINLVATSSLHTVYLATDNATIIDYELDGYPELSFITQDGLRRFGGRAGGDGDWKAGYRNDKLELFLTTMVELDMLSRGEIFVGSESSGFTHLVKARRLAERAGTSQTWALDARGKAEEVVVWSAWFDL